MSNSADTGAATLSVTVDNDLCQGHARCWHIAPEFFTLDDEGYSDIGENKPVPPGMDAAARNGVASCPEHALTISESSRH